MKLLMISRAMVAASHRGRLREMAKLGLRLTVVAPERWEYQSFEPAERDGYELVRRRTGLAWPALGSMAHHTFYYRGIADLVRRDEWDLVHMDDEPFNFATFQVLKLCGAAGRRAIFSTEQNLMKKYPPPFALFERYAFQIAPGAVAGNAGALEVLRKRGFPGATALIPRFGVDPDFFRRADASDLRAKLGVGDSFVVGYVGRVVREKGLDTLVRAIKLLPAEACLVLVGGGPYAGRLRALIASSGLERRVRWVPWVKTTEVAKYMNAFDVFALPSRTTSSWKEQFGRVLIEAMACETCVVGSDSGEIRNTIGDGGLIFHEGDDRGLAELLRGLMGDSGLRESVGRRGRERVLECFTHSKVARDAASFYRSVCSGLPVGALPAGGSPSAR
jgi:glycosyltransferase involved in cell wall biosynthesis